LHSQGSSTIGGDLLHNHFGALTVARVVHGDSGAAVGERRCDAGADHFRAAGDDGDPALQAVHGHCSVSLFLL
jgi:hypothetical protein